MKPYDNLTLNSNRMFVHRLSWLLNFPLEICDTWREFLSQFKSQPHNFNDSNNYDKGHSEFRYRAYWLELSVNQQGLIVNKIVSESQSEHDSSMLVNWLNDYFDSQTLRFTYEDNRFFCHSSMPLPNDYPSIYQVYKQNLMSQVKFDEYAQWLALLNEIQMLLNQKSHCIEGFNINGMWPSFFDSLPIQGGDLIDEQGVHFALKDDFDGLANWLAGQLNRARELAKYNAKYMLYDGELVWFRTGLKKSITQMKSWFKHV